ncbi:MAG: allophanate hydrolase subunit 1 [Chloroflexi bacterium]|nr:MAG: allophanate hydrolase subunit 1 [Chloroflexota bacterium]
MQPQRSTVRVRVHPLGDTALIAELGTRLDTALNTRAIALASALKKRRDVRQAVPAHGNVTVQFDPDQITYEALAAAIRRLATKRPPVEEPGRLHRIPVVYDGPDLESHLSPRQPRGLAPARAQHGQAVPARLRPPKPVSRR